MTWKHLMLGKKLNLVRQKQILRMFIKLYGDNPDYEQLIWKRRLQSKNNLFFHHGEKFGVKRQSLEIPETEPRTACKDCTVSLSASVAICVSAWDIEIVEAPVLAQLTHMPLFVPFRTWLRKMPISPKKFALWWKIKMATVRSLPFNIYGLTSLRLLKIVQTFYTVLLQLL